MSLNLPLEDNFNDLVGKAMRGLKFADSEVASRAGVTAAAVQSLREGRWDESTARAVAPVLGLGADALVAAGNRAWLPAPVTLERFAQFNTPFDDMAVNAYLAWDAVSREAVVFDTGADASGLLALIAEENLQVGVILLTHTHGDHIFDLDRLREKTGAPAFVGDRESLDGAESFTAGRTFRAGGLNIETRLTWGHSRGGITYVVTGLARPVAIVGDSIFAGSMGGGGVDYQAALRTNREQVFTLSDDTILAPGHGPLTTVGEERMHNPFFAA